MIGRYRRLLSMLAALMVVGLLVLGCAQGAGPGAVAPATEPPEEAPAEEAGPKQGGTLTIARPSDAISLDSMLETTAPGAWVYVNILEPLIRLNPQMEIEPVLAERWEVVDDTRIRFHLREGVEFHDGEPFNADAVVFNFERFLESDPPARWAPLAGPLEGAEKVDEYTVDVLTSQPYGPVLRALAMPYVHMVSPKAAKELGEDFGRQPVGTGPFKFVEWRTDDRIVLERNENYWGEAPYLDRVVFRVMPEESVRMLALRSGEVDMVLKPAPAELASLEEDPNFTIRQAKGLRVVFVGFNVNMEPADNAQLRQAVAHAINVDSILENILEGAATQATGYISPGVFGYADTNLREEYQYDPDQAQQLLKEIGYTETDDEGYLVNEDGERVTLKFLGFRGRYLKDGEIIEAVQAQLKEVGIQLQVDFLEWGAAFSQLRSETMPYHMYMMGWVTTNADADYTLYSLFHSAEEPPRGWNRARYANPEVDRPLEAARVSLDQDERQELYAEAQEILVDDVLLIPIYNTVEIAVTGEYVRDFEMHPVEYNLFLEQVRLDK